MDIKKLGLTIILLQGLTAVANASLVEVDYLVAGDKLLTRDTESNLEWLDLTSTVSISYLGMLNELGPGGMYQGFRFATVDDIDRLQVNIGLVPGLFTTTFSGNVILAIDLLDKVGITVPPSPSGTYSSYGITGTAFDPTTSIDDRIIREFRISLGGVAMSTLQGVIDDDQPSSQVGNWLLRETPSPIPLPATWILFISAAALMFRFSRANTRSSV